VAGEERDCDQERWELMISAPKLSLQVLQGPAGLALISMGQRIEAPRLRNRSAPLRENRAALQGSTAR